MSSKTALSYWTPALLAAALGTFILFDRHPGLNWGIWVAATAVGLITVRRIAGRPLSNHTLVLLGWATVLAFAQSLTAVPAGTPIIILTVAILLGLTVTTLDDSPAGITLPTVAVMPFMAVSRVAAKFVTELFGIPRNITGLKNRPGLRGALLALPIVIILIALLSRADPVLEAVSDTLFGWMANWVIDEKFVFFLFLAAITLGAYALAASDREQQLPAIPDLQPPFKLTHTETRIILGSVNAVLWLFVVLQLFSLTRDPAGAAGTGVTYAEYARRGFAELSVAAAIMLGVLLFTEVFRNADSAGKPRTLELAAILAVEIILISAFRRVLLYESAYGFTTDRLIAQVFMVVLAIAFILLAADLRKGSVSSAFGRRGMTLTLVALTAFTYWNYEAWIVRKNVERAQQGAELDVKYLGRLSIGAAPELVAQRNAMTPAQRTELDTILRCKQVEKTSHWYEWNLRRENARAVLQPYMAGCPRPEVGATARPSGG